MNDMPIPDILSYLPHRYPFLLIDRVLEYDLSKRIVALKNVSMNEPFFPGHFPGRPVMPGVLILEALAQASVILGFLSAQSTADSGTLYYFAGIEDARFKRLVVPGDQLRLEVEIEWERRGIFKLNGTAWVEKELACSAKILSAKKDPEK